jgi:hypothetical protein
MAVRISYIGTLDILRISDLYGGKFVHSNKMLLTNLLLFFSTTAQTSVAAYYRIQVLNIVFNYIPKM